MSHDSMTFGQLCLPEVHADTYIKHNHALGLPFNPELKVRSGRDMMIQKVEKHIALLLFQSDNLPHN